MQTACAMQVRKPRFDAQNSHKMSGVVVEACGPSMRETDGGVGGGPGVFWLAGLV